MKKKKNRVLSGVKDHFLTIVTLVVFLIAIIAIIHSYFFFYRSIPPALKPASYSYERGNTVFLYIDHLNKYQLADSRLVATIEMTYIPLTAISGNPVRMEYNDRQQRYEGKWKIGRELPMGAYRAQVIIPGIKTKPLILSTLFYVKR